MKFKLHNKLTVSDGKNTYTFFNQIFPNVYEKIKKLEPYFSHIAVGTGSNENASSDHKLQSYKKTIKLETENLQDDITTSLLLSKKYAIVDSYELDDQYISEIGITSDTETNPEIFNYFSLISDENPNGIKKVRGQNLILSITIFLELESTDNLTTGSNPLIDLLLGEGTKSKEVVAIKGANLSDKPNISRLLPSGEKIKADISSNTDNGLELNFKFDLKNGEIYEIVLSIDDIPFWRKNVMHENELSSSSVTLTPREHEIIVVGNNIHSIEQVKNTSTNTTETSVVTSKYANEIGGEISLPFHNLFDADTPRFLSKEGDKIFFLIDDYIFAYQNLNYELIPLKTYDLHILNVQKIVAFDNYLFVISKSEPFVQGFVLNSESISEMVINLDNFNYKNNLSDIYDFDATQAKNGKMMFGFIFTENLTASAVYLDYDADTNTLVFDSENDFEEHELTTVIAMYKNNFSDALIIFLKHGELSFKCKIVNNYPDKTYTDVYSVLAYYYACNTKNVEAKNRAIIVQKSEPPFFWIYFYPQIYRYELQLISDEIDDYISTNLSYLIQKHKNNEYKIYSLAEFNNPEEFSVGFPETINKNKIVDFEFLNDVLIVFTSDEKAKTIGLSLKNTRTRIDNVSDSEASYEISTKNYNLLGTDEGVILNFKLEVQIWFFQRQFLNLHQAQVFQSMQKTKITMNSLLKTMAYKNTI